MSIADIVILVVLVIFILTGIFKGVFKILGGALGFVACVVISSLLLGFLADFLMDLGFVADSVTSSAAPIAESLGTLDIVVNSMADIPNGALATALTGAGVPDFLAGIISPSFSANVEAIVVATPGLLLSTIVATALTRIIVEVVAFILILILSCVIVSSICKILDKVFRKFVITKLISSLLGMVVNFAIGTVIIMAVCWIVADVIQLGIFVDLAQDAPLLAWVLDNNIITALASGGDVATTLGNAIVSLPEAFKLMIG
ncbi:MAG: CvpA family protein [Clostridia bacterium]|nr:CvpA family protein [Clostridia bacterium]